MRRTRLRILIPLGIFCAGVGLGAVVASRLAPERLRGDTERLLAEALKAPVSIGSVRSVLRDGIGLDGADVRVWTASQGWALEVREVSARLDPIALLAGEVRLSELVLRGARLQIERDAEGVLTPRFSAHEPDTEAEIESPRDALMAPLQRVESIVSGLLQAPGIASSLEIHDSEIAFADALGSRRADDPLRMSLQGLSATLHYDFLRDQTHFSARARFLYPGGESRPVEVEAHRARSGVVQATVAVTELQLEAAAPYAWSAHPDSMIAGALSGVLRFESGEANHARVEVDLVADQVASVFPPESAEIFGAIEADRVELRGAVDIDPEQLRVEETHLVVGELDLHLEGSLDRPLDAHSRTQLEVTLHDVDLEQVRHLISWLPEVEREGTTQILRPVEAAHLELLRADGTAKLSDWSHFLAGRSWNIPEGWNVDAYLSDALVRAGDGDEIGGLSARLWWNGDRLEIRDAQAQLNGEPLPRLDVSLDGLPHFFAIGREWRTLHSNAEPLLGLRALWRLLGLDREKDEPAEMRTRAQFHFSHLDHPMFLWPIHDLEATLDPVEGGFHVVTSGGTWAGVPVRGTALWLFEPTERVEVQLSALPQGAAPERELAASTAPEGPEQGEGDSEAEPRPWAEGRFEIGSILEKGWRHTSAMGRFSATAGRIHLQDLDVDLEPVGHLGGTVEIELAKSDLVPLSVEFEVQGGDVATLFGQVGLPLEFATGSIDLRGSLAGRFDPEDSLLDALSGSLEIQAMDGQVRHNVPAVVAVALASKSINPFASREQVRYDRVETILRFANGVMTTESFTLDGPDARVFASGSVELTSDSQQLQAQVALYLFRQLDSVIGKIPLVSTLLLGPDKNLAALYYELAGPWSDPQAKLIPLESLASAPGPSVLQGVHSFVRRGIAVLESIFEKSEEPEIEEPEVPQGG